MNNTKINSIEISESRTVLKSKPPLVYVELTQNCNCSCLMCYRSRPEYRTMSIRDAEMKKGVYELIANELFMTAELVDLRGFGETTIYTEILNILDYNKRNYPDIRYKMISNGKAIDTKLMRAMADLDIDLYISFDAAEKDLFQYLRRGNSYDAVVNTIRKWNRIFNKDNTARLLVTLHRYNSDKLADIARFASDNGCQLLSVSEIDPMTGPNWIADHETASGEITKCLEICATAGLDMVIPTAYMDSISIKKEWKTLVVEKCTAPWNTVLIKYDGSISSCSHKFSEMGNVSLQPFEDIWNSSRFRMLRSGKNNKDNPCTGCKRNALAYIGTGGAVREVTWRLIDRQQAARIARNSKGGQYV